MRDRYPTNTFTRYSIRRMERWRETGRKEGGMEWKRFIRHCLGSRCARRKYLINDIVWVNVSRHISLFRYQTHLRERHKLRSTCTCNSIIFRVLCQRVRSILFRKYLKIPCMYNSRYMLHTARKRRVYAGLKISLTGK